MKGPKLNRDWIGLRVRLLRKASNLYVKIPAGYEGVVDAYSPGQSAIRFLGDKCECCGVAPLISALHRRDLEILTPTEEWPNTAGKGRKVRP